MWRLADLWTNIIGTCNFLLRNGKQKLAERFAKRFAKPDAADHSRMSLPVPDFKDFFLRSSTCSQ